MWLIWDYQNEDWVTTAGWDGNILMAFRTKKEACRQVVLMSEFESYAEAKRKGWYEVRRFVPAGEVS